MTSNRIFRRGLAALAAVTVLGLGLAGPARADDDDVGKKAKERAKDACRDLLRHQDYKDADLGDMRVREDGNRIIYEVQARRGGKDRDISCTYDRDSKETFLNH